MEQQPYFFNDSVQYNILYADPTATQEEMHNACRKAFIHDTIVARKHGYKASVGENGKCVSLTPYNKCILTLIVTSLEASVNV